LDLGEELGAGDIVELVAVDFPQDDANRAAVELGEEVF